MKRLIIDKENMDDLILVAISNANGRYKGHSILEHCFKKMNIEQMFHHFSKEDRTVFFEIYQMLLDDGANAGVLIRKKTEEFLYLQKATVECLRLITVLLLSEQIKNNANYKKRFDHLLEAAAALLAQIEQENFIASKSNTKEDRPTEITINKTVVDTEMKHSFRISLMFEQDNEDRKGDVVCKYEECMRGIYRLQTQPWLTSLEVLIKIGANVSAIIEGGCLVPIFKLEHLLETATDAIRLITETMRGRGAVPAIKESTAITDNFSELNELLKEIIFRKEEV